MGNLTEKDKILAFSHTKFISEGFYRTTMDEIAKELHISKKTIYKHFPSKEILLEEVCHIRMKIVEELLDSVTDSEDDTITKFLKILNKQKSLSINCSPLWFRDLELHAPHLKKEFEKLRKNKVTKILIKLLEQGKKEKVVENIPSDILITAFNGAIEAVTNSEFILNSKYSFHDVMRITAEIFLNGFLTPYGKDKYSKSKKLFDNLIQLETTL